MKPLRAVFFGLIVSLIFLIPGYSFSAIGDLRVSYLDGDVQVKEAGTSDWVPASINMPVMDGDAIWVPDGGRAGIQLRDGTYVRLDENSSLEILSTASDAFQFNLSLGHAYVNFKGQQGYLMQMDTPVSSTRAFAKAKFMVDVADDGFTDVAVLKGSVTTEGGGGRTKVTAGKILSLGGETYAELAPLGPADNWERWNSEMDRKAERRYASSYLPSELISYSPDFEENGRWVSTSEYGNVWTPTVIAVDWAPYRDGRWTWIGGDYVWVSYDPWGWAPYHYGRWAFDASFGWCWVPPARGDVYWGPGYVGWVDTGSYLAWVPLAPGEIYYGHGNYGKHSVNITNININTVRVTTVYRNVNVNNGITVVNRDTFISGSPSRVDAAVVAKIRDNNFIARKIEVGRPQIAPTKASYMPVMKSIPAAKEPPRAIKQIQVNQLKESRPMVKGPSQSVLKPGAQLKTMPVTTLKESKRPGAAVQSLGVKPGIPEVGVKKPSTPVTREIQKPAGVPTGREIQQPTGAPTTREIQKPTGAPTGREVQKPAGVPMGREVQKPAGAPATREVQKPAGAPTGREVQKPAGVPMGREVQKPAGVPMGREIQKPAGAPAPSQPVGQGTPQRAQPPQPQKPQQKQGTTTEKEQVTEPGVRK